MKENKKQFLHTLFIFTGVTACYIFFMAVTNPYKLPIAALVIPSLLLGAVLYQFVRLLQQARLLKLKKLTAILLAIYGVLLSLLASLQQLSWRDAFLAGVLLWLFVFYYSRSRN